MKSCLIAFTVNDGRVFLLNLNALCVAELLDGSILELKTKIRGDNLAAGQDCDILQHCLSTIAVAGSLNSNNVKGSAQLVDDQGGQSLALYVLCNDEELCAHLYDLLQYRQDVLNAGNLLVGDQDVRILKVCNHLLGIVNHVCADIATVKLHAFYQIQLGVHGLGLLDGDDAILGNLLHGISDHLADLSIAGRNGSYLLDVLFTLYGCAHLLDGLNCSIGRLLHTLAEHDRVRTCCQVLHAFVDHGLCQYGSSCGSVAGNIIGLGSSLADDLCTHVLELILELDLLCNGNTIIGNGRCAVALIQNNIASLRSQCDLYCVRQFVNAFCKSNSCICSHL